MKALVGSLCVLACVRVWGGSGGACMCVKQHVYVQYLSMHVHKHTYVCMYARKKACKHARTHASMNTYSTFSDNSHN